MKSQEILSFLMRHNSCRTCREKNLPRCICPPADNKKKAGTSSEPAPAKKIPTTLKDRLTPHLDLISISHDEKNNQLTIDTSALPKEIEKDYIASLKNEFAEFKAMLSNQGVDVSHFTSTEEPNKIIFRMPKEYAAQYINQLIDKELLASPYQKPKYTPFSTMPK